MDLYLFGPPGSASGSVRQRYGSGSASGSVPKCLGSTTLLYGHVLFNPESVDSKSLGPGQFLCDKMALMWKKVMLLCYAKPGLIKQCSYFVSGTLFLSVNTDWLIVGAGWSSYLNSLVIGRFLNPSRNKLIVYKLVHFIGWRPQNSMSHSVDSTVGYSDFHNFMGFNSKKMPNNIFKNVFWKSISIG